MFSGFRGQKLKTSLRLSVNRLKLLEAKKTELAQKARREIADYIANNKVDRARIRVEHIIREDYLVEAYELLELYCDMLLARFGLIETMKEIDEGMVEAISSVVWATPRLQGDIAELKGITEQLQKKYGKELIQEFLANTNNHVNERLIHKLSPQPPPRILVERYLMEIAKNYNVPFEPNPEVMMDEEVILADTRFKMKEDEFVPMPTLPAGAPVLMPQPLVQPFNAIPPPEANLPPVNLGPNQPVDSFQLNLPDIPSHKASCDFFFQPFNPIPPPEANLPPVNPGPNQPVDTFQLNLPDIPSHNLSRGSSPGDASENVDFDDLARRFEELKKKN